MPPIGVDKDKQGPLGNELALRAWDRKKESQNIEITGQGGRWYSPGNTGVKSGCKTLAAVRSEEKPLPGFCTCKHGQLAPASHATSPT